jgi:hypothetical protein
MTDGRPGLNPDRLVRLMQEAVQNCQLQLAGSTVLTEAATGAYAVTAVLAALAGAARVFALARPTRYDSAEEAASATLRLAERSGVERSIRIITEKSPEVMAEADIVTNSGRLRPIDVQTVSWMKPGATVPLMFEAWEFRPQDVDLDACRRRGVAVAGTNEQHPAVDVFSYLGVLACKLLTDAGVAVYRSRVLVLCDNPFLPHLVRGLKGAGAVVDAVSELAATGPQNRYDAILVSLHPQPECGLDAAAAAAIAQRWPGAIVAQFLGNIDRSGLAAAGVPVWPDQAPALGHMGILLSDIGPEPIVRLQAGGLKVGQLLLQKCRGALPSEWASLLQPLVEPK